MLNFTTTSALAQSQGVKILVHGPSGIGKTCLCGTATRPLIVAAESRTQSLRRQDLPAIKIRSLDDLNDLYRWCCESSDSQYVSTLCIDSISEIAETLLEQAKPVFKDPRKAYGEMLDQMIKVVRLFRDLPGKHVVMTAKQEWTKDEATGVFRYQPSLPGSKLGPALPYLFDEVFCMRIGTLADGRKYRYLQTQADLQYDAKDSSGLLAEIEEPDLTKVINKIEGRT